MTTTTDAEKSFNRWTSICPGCYKEISNGAYFGPVAGRGSAHINGTCRLPRPGSSRLPMSEDWVTEGEDEND